MTDFNALYDEERKTLSWPRIGGTAFAIALHIAGFMMLLAPVSSPTVADEDEEVTTVNFIEPPPPPPPPPPEPPKTITKIVETPKPSPVPPPPEDPPMVYDDPSPVAIAAPPPAPPAPPTGTPDFAASEDPSGRSMFKPNYPPEEQRRGITGSVILLVQIDASGQVLEVTIEKSSGNRNLDRSAMQAARRWRFNPGSRSGVKVGGTVRVPVNFTL